MKKTIEASIRLRRDNESNFEKIKDTFIPLSGEVILVDTSKNGLRAKVGDGISTYAELQYTDTDIRDPVIHGYLKNGNFYKDITYSSLVNPQINKIFIDDETTRLYFYDGSQYIPLQRTFTVATATEPGLVKLYSTTGQNTDGTMTQKAITDELDLRFKTEIDSENELLTFFI